MRIFLKNPALSRTTSRGFLSPCQKSEKTNDQIPRKLPDRHTDMWKDRQTDPISLDPSPATAGGPIKNFD